MLVTDHTNISSDREKQLFEKLVSHPLEQAFNITPGSTVLLVPEPRKTQLVEDDDYDDKDQEIEQAFQEVYDKAMDTFDDMQDQLAAIDVMVSARSQEVAAMMLNTALNAAKEKARMKEHKDKQKTSGSKTNRDPNTGDITNNITISSSDLIKMLAQERNPLNNHVIEAEVAEIVEAVPEVTRTTIPRKPKSE